MLGELTMDADAIAQALSAAMRHSDMAMVLSDPRLPDCPMIAANAAFSDLSGYGRDEIIGRNCRFLQGSNTDPHSSRRIRSCVEAGQGCVEWIVNYRRDGAMFWNLLFISPVRDAAGNLVFFFGSQLDITKGMPEGMDDFSLGRAHIVPELKDEFHALLHEIVERTDQAEHAAPVLRAQALERIVTAARRLAEISTSLVPGAEARGA